MNYNIICDKVSNGIIQSGDTIIFQAGETITLTPGFRAESGSAFYARIGTCISPWESFIDTEPMTNPSGNQSTAAGVRRRYQSDTPFWHSRVWPNPFREAITLEVHLQDVASVTARLTTHLSQHVAITLPPSVLPGGLHQITLPTSSLPAGVYLLLITADGHTQTHRIIRIE